MQIFNNKKHKGGNDHGKAREREIRMKISNDEYDLIAINAKEAQMQIAPYIRRAAINPNINVIDYSIIEKHTREIGSVRNDINRLVFTIQATNNYLPRDIGTIVALLEGIFRSENELLQAVRESRNKQQIAIFW